MGGYGDVRMIDENGLRMDGRKPGDVRPITIETGVVPVADGSCRMVWGTNEAIVAVYGPMEAHPRKIQRQDRAVIDVAYNMAPFSTTDRIRPGFNRRSREISKEFSKYGASRNLHRQYGSAISHKSRTV